MAAARFRYCFIPLFYIKPQQISNYPYYCIIALYLFSTSNHNPRHKPRHGTRLLYTSFLHQTTTTAVYLCLTLDCFIPLFYIKPQLIQKYTKELKIALYLFSTSNHNTKGRIIKPTKLLYTSFLHQTTTRHSNTKRRYYCFIPLFYIKPQLGIAIQNAVIYCFIPLFYIKPQLI